MDLCWDTQTQSAFSCVVLLPFSQPVSQSDSKQPVETHVDYIDHLLGFFGLASTVTGDIDVSFGHEDVPGWQRLSFHTVLSR